MLVVCTDTPEFCHQQTQGKSWVYMAKKCGMSKVPLKIVEPNEKRLEWISFPIDFLSQKWTDSIMKVVNRNNLVI